MSEQLCQCGHTKASHDHGSEMRVDDALLSQRPAQWNIYTDEPRGKTRCQTPECLCLNWRPEDAEAIAQDVVNVCGRFTSSGNGSFLSKDFMALFDKADAYRKAKSYADNHREHQMLTAKDEEEERVTCEQFLDLHREFVNKHQRAARG
jgi:hypothetical protein